MTMSLCRISIFLSILLNVFTSIITLQEQHISACKTSEYYGEKNVELICSNEESSTDIFTNTSTTGTVVCLDNKATRTNYMNSISFTNCTFRRAPIHLFNYFPLETIGLQSTSLQRLDKYDFVDTPLLQKLLVIHNNLTTIPANLFKFTPSIKSVFLSNNEIVDIHPQAFNATHGIKFLDLSNNRLTKVSKALFDTLSKLESLYLSRNSITEIEPEAFSSMSRLDALDLDGNKLEVITSNMFTGLWFAYRLDLSSNNIRRIEANAFSALSSLMTLGLNSNAIDSDGIQPNAFHGLKTIYRLSMNHNKLTILRKGMFDGIPGLQYLELRDNQIVAIEPLAFNHAELHDLDLSSNRISEISSDVFSHAPNMNSVNLSNTNIAEIKEGFLSSAPKLFSLDLSSTKLKAIDFNHFSRFASSLQSLYVNGNELTQLPDEIREILPNLSNLGIANNKFSCSYFREVFPTIGAKILSKAIERHPIARNETNVHGIRCY